MITYKLFTNQGGREINEDSAKVVEKDGKYCFLLADGLGGHGKGEVASALVVAQGEAEFITSPSISIIPECFDSAQEILLEEQHRQNAESKMKTTMVILAIENEDVQWGHVGDSRLYHFNKNKIVRRTLDHSVPQMLVMAGEIKEKQIRGHEDRNRLLRVMGTPWDGPQYAISEVVKTKDCQAFLLCSDGFWELIEEKAMISFLKKSKTVEEWMNRMVEEVQKNGVGKNMDNYTAIAVWIS